MRGPKLLLVILAALALLTGCAGAAFAVALPIAHDFEDVYVGGYPNANGWRTGLAGVTAYVSIAAAHSPTRSFRLQSYPYASRCDYILIDQVPDRMAYQASIRVDQVRGRSAWFGLGCAVANTILPYDRFILTNDTGSVGTVYFSGISDLPPLIVGTFLPSQWITIGAELDFGRQTADLWLNGMLAMSDVPIEPKEFVDAVYGHVVLNRLAAGESNWSGGGTGVIFVDDVAAFELVPPTIEAVVDILPNTLGLRSKGRWVTCYIELPEGYSVADIDVGSLVLNETLPSDLRPVAIGDYDLDGVPDLMVKFNRVALARMLAPGSQEIVLTGCLIDETPIAGADVVRVIR